MTKTEELSWIKDLIQKHGSSTYLGAWLKDHEAEIESCLAADFPLTMVPYMRGRDWKVRAK